MISLCRAHWRCCRKQKRRSWSTGRNWERGRNTGTGFLVGVFFLILWKQQFWKISLSIWNSENINIFIKKVVLWTFLEKNPCEFVACELLYVIYKFGKYFQKSYFQKKQTKWVSRRISTKPSTSSWSASSKWPISISRGTSSWSFFQIIFLSQFQSGLKNALWRNVLFFRFISNYILKYLWGFVEEKYSFDF